MVAFLATRPVRLENHASIDLGKHLIKVQDTYWCRFRHEETKEKEPLEFPISRAAQPFLDRYLAVHRPLLLRGTNRPTALDIDPLDAMADNSIYCRVTTCTERLIGRPINPHLFRDCAATFIAEVAPEEIRIVARILGHSKS